MTEERRNPHLEHALALAELGYAVFPIVPRGKVPAISRANGGNGFQDATTDAAQIEAWWRSNPQRNIGIATGASNLVVVDRDDEAGGEDSMGDLVTDHGDGWLDTVIGLTPKGVHYYYRAPEGIRIQNSAGTRLGPGIDIRADGGYVVAHPSYRPDGRYEWEADHAPWDRVPADLPAWLITRLTERRSRDASEDEALGETIPQGQRDTRLTSIAGGLRRMGLGEVEILESLISVNRRCVPPLPDSDLRRIARSVASYAPGKDVPARLVRHTPNVTEYTRLRKVATDPPTWLININGHDLKLPTAAVLDHKGMYKLALEQHDILLDYMSPKEWKDQLEVLLQELEILQAPEDASESGLIWTSICSHLQKLTVDDDVLFPTRPLRNGDFIYVSGPMLRSALKQDGILVDQRKVWDVIRVHGGESKVVRLGEKSERSVRAWVIPKPEGVE